VTQCFENTFQGPLLLPDCGSDVITHFLVDDQHACLASPSLEKELPAQLPQTDRIETIELPAQLPQTDRIETISLDAPPLRRNSAWSTTQFACLKTRPLKYCSRDRKNKFRVGRHEFLKDDHTLHALFTDTSLFFNLFFSSSCCRSETRFYMLQRRKAFSFFWHLLLFLTSSSSAIHHWLKMNTLPGTMLKDEFCIDYPRAYSSFS